MTVPSQGTTHAYSDDIRYCLRQGITHQDESLQCNCVRHDGLGIDPAGQ